MLAVDVDDVQKLPMRVAIELSDHGGMRDHSEHFVEFETLPW